jgi:hypothetical protein
LLASGRTTRDTRFRLSFCVAGKPYPLVGNFTST